VFAGNLFYLQVLNPDYKNEAFSNVRKRIVDPPVRGMIYARDTSLLVSNSPVFNFFITAKYLQIDDTLDFCTHFGITKKELLEKLAKARERGQRRKPTLLLKHVPQRRFTVIQDRLDEFPGITYEAHTMREYRTHSLANALGYVREIDKKMYKKDTTGYYQMGDLVGYSGIEANYEKELRGRRGVRYVYVDVQQNVKGSFIKGQFDTLPEIGKNLLSSIDIDLQQYGEQLMGNKIGSIVAIEPATGEILSMISAPSYNPELLTGDPKQVAQNIGMLLGNNHKPLFNRTVMSPYPPGSIIKLIQALIGLQEGVIDSVETRIPCTQSLVKCHSHPSPLNLRGSIQHSCNPFYFRVFNKIIAQGQAQYTMETARIGMEKWKNYMHKFGLGHQLGSDIYNEKGGRIPSPEYYDKKFKSAGWKFSNIYSLSIGQGEMGVVPLQMANLAAIMANRGHYITPHIIKEVEEKGKFFPVDEKYRQRHETGIKREFFEVVIDGMENVVRAGTARKAAIPGIVVCGKTGTAQNPHGEDHSVFVGFAPRDNPKIAIVVYVENAGFGGTWAAPIASLMMEKYLNGEVKRAALEKTVLNKDFITPKVKKKKEGEEEAKAADAKIASLQKQLQQVLPVAQKTLPVGPAIPVAKVGVGTTTTQANPSGPNNQGPDQPKNQPR
jgi:penicillin-binding protein 2